MQLKTPVMVQGQLKTNFNFANKTEAQKFVQQNGIQSEQISFVKGMEILELIAGTTIAMKAPVSDTIAKATTLGSKEEVGGKE